MMRVILAVVLLMVAAALLSLLAAVMVPASAQYSCDQVRAYVASVGTTQAASIARAAGATKRQMAKARRCMRGH